MLSSELKESLRERLARGGARRAGAVQSWSPCRTLDPQSAATLDSESAGLRRLDAFSRQHVFNLQRIHSRFRFEVIVGNYIRYLSFLRDAFDLLFPATQLRFAVQIVVAVGSFLCVEPLIVIAPVETHVTEL